MLSTVTEFQEKYPEFIEVENDGLNAYSSEVHFKYSEGEFETGEFNKEEYTTGLDKIYREAIKKDKSIGWDVEKVEKIQLEYMKKCAYISVYYDDYAEIENIKVGYGWE